MRGEGKSCRKTVLRGEQSLSNSDGASGTSTWQTGDGPQAFGRPWSWKARPSGRTRWEEFLGSQLGTWESPGLLSAHLSSPCPLPRLTPALPGLQPGIQAGRGLGSHAQLSPAGHIRHNPMWGLRSLPRSLVSPELSHPLGALIPERPLPASLLLHHKQQ